MYWVTIERVNPEFAPFYSNNGCTWPDTVFLPLIQLYQGGGFFLLSVFKEKLNSLINLSPHNVCENSFLEVLGP